MKFKAPIGSTGINIGGEQFNVDEDGNITVPHNGNYIGTLTSHGFEFLGDTDVDQDQKQATDAHADDAQGEDVAEDVAEEAEEEAVVVKTIPPEPEPAPEPAPAPAPAPAPQGKKFNGKRK